MQRFLFSVSLLLLCLLTVPSIVGAQTKTPIEFNDELVSITDQLYKKGQAWGKTFNESFKAKDFTLLIPVRKELETFVDQQLARVKAMKDVKDSKVLRQAMIDFLLFEKTMIAKAFKPIEALGKNPSNDEINKAYENLKIYSGQEGEALNKVNKAQEAYAAANGFRIEKPEAAIDEDD